MRGSEPLRASQPMLLPPALPPPFRVGCAVLRGRCAWGPQAWLAAPPPQMAIDEYDSMAFPVVSPDAAKVPEYPYVFVTEDGAVHELDADDRSYLETPFHPCDGARPFTKSKYADRNGWGNLRGYCPRAVIPSDIPILAEPVRREPPKPIIETIREYTERAGLSLVENPDGTFTTARPPQKRWWQFWK
jgi:hypothetical protein